MRKILLVPIVLAALSGCATVTLPQAAASGTTLDIYVNNDASGFVTGRHAGVTAYDDANCGNPVVIAKKAFINPQDTLDKTPIPAGKPLTLSFHTTQSQYALMGTCSVTATFTPQPNQAYRALLALHYDQQTCELQIADQNDLAVALQKPVYSCFKNSAGIGRNGQALRQEFKVNLITLPAK